MQHAQARPNDALLADVLTTTMVVLCFLEAMLTMFSP